MAPIRVNTDLHPQVAESESIGTEFPCPQIAKPVNQQTIATEACVTGVGFVTGADVTVRFTPAGAEEGIVFVRTDLAGLPRIPVNTDHLLPRRRRTALGLDGATVEMTEHILASLSGLGIDNCKILIDAGEAPGMDGSAKPFVDVLDRVGIRELSVPRRPFVVREPIRVSEGQAMVIARPGPTDCLRITFELDYGNNPGIGRQRLAVRVNPELFRDEISPARTFILEQEVEQLRKEGLGKRATARDLLIFGEDGQLIDNDLRFPDECVRHKILDLIGDLALLGRPLHGHVLAHKSGHDLNTRLVRELSRETRNSEINP